LELIRIVTHAARGQKDRAFLGQADGLAHARCSLGGRSGLQKPGDDQGDKQTKHGDNNHQLNHRETPLASSAQAQLTQKLKPGSTVSFYATAQIKPRKCNPETRVDVGAGLCFSLKTIDGWGAVSPLGCWVHGGQAKKTTGIQADSASK
jgi:hypothetical protein